MEETLTDKDFCQTFKIDRATSLRWRDLGIVGYVKLPNGAIRYRQKHIDQLWANFEKMEKLGVTLKDLYRTLKGGVVDVGVPKRSRDVAVTKDTANLGNCKTALYETCRASVPEVVEAEINDPGDPFSGCPRSLDCVVYSEHSGRCVSAWQCKQFSEQARGHKNGS